ncbi:C4-type zinc ribbon domain-containing protein [uncultured Corynebacterium sp.]|uniref:zinc ribbon domain-containing protein n=1 Tax=uncultured Corynebacterium sp. TaxID=159447 RepID=UPI0025F85BC6|nr:C4-type zinc ribbon domain-containing protein [uncultured Corynebacterium sp.]
MKLSAELHPILLELANLERSQGVTVSDQLPEQVELAALETKLERLRAAAGSAQMAVDDMELEILRIQADERKLRARERDDKAQLTAELDPEKRRDLEHDRYAAKSRINDLLSELQEAHNEIHALRNNVDVHGAQVSELERQVEAARRAADAAVAARAAQPDPSVRIGELRAQLPADALKVYDQVRHENGVGAAKFSNRACNGCFIELPPAAVSAIRGAAADELPECPDCGSLLVR